MNKPKKIAVLMGGPGEEKDVSMKSGQAIKKALNHNGYDVKSIIFDIKLEKSDIKKVEDLKEKFKIICDTLCSKIDSIDERLSNINVENES